MFDVGTPLGILPSPSSLAGLPIVTTVATSPPSLDIGTSSEVLTTVLAGTAHSGSGALTWPSSSAGGSGGSAGLLNLLPLSLAHVLPPTGGVYVGEGLLPIPPKLAAKILKWEFVEMAEMLPEYWPGAKPDEDIAKRAPARRPCQVTDIFTWIQCYASYISVLAGRFTESVPELMAYMYLVTITRVSQDFTGLAWVRYDASFRRQAAITGNRKWSQINPSLYLICFTGCALAVTRCDLCLSSSDSAFDGTTHLAAGDVRVDSTADPHYLEVHIKASKTDPFRQGVFVYHGHTSTRLCPVTAILAYMVLRGT